MVEASYLELIEILPTEKWKKVTDKLTNLILSSKNDAKMPSQLANTILHRWQQDTLVSRFGMAALLEAAVLLEPEKTLAAFEELQLTNIAETIKEHLPKAEK